MFLSLTCSFSINRPFLLYGNYPPKICRQTTVNSVKSSYNCYCSDAYFTYVLTCLYFSLNRDPKSGNWRVYLKDGKVDRTVPERTPTAVNERSSGTQSLHSTQLSSRLKNKSPTRTSQYPHQVCDIADVMTFSVMVLSLIVQFTFTVVCTKASCFAVVEKLC